MDATSSSFCLCTDLDTLQAETGSGSDPGSSVLQYAAGGSSQCGVVISVDEVSFANVLDDESEGAWTQLRLDEG